VDAKKHLHQACKLRIYLKNYSTDYHQILRGTVSSNLPTTYKNFSTTDSYLPIRVKATKFCTYIYTNFWKYSRIPRTWKRKENSLPTPASFTKGEQIPYFCTKSRQKKFKMNWWTAECCIQQTIWKRTDEKSCFRFDHYIKTGFHIKLAWTSAKTHNVVVCFFYNLFSIILFSRFHFSIMSVFLDLHET